MPPSHFSVYAFPLSIFPVSHSCPPISSFYLCRFELSLSHRDITPLTSQIQRERLITSVQLSVWNYCRQASIPPTLSSSDSGGRRAHHAAASSPQLYAVCITSLPHLLSALLGLIPKESNFALTQNSRSKRQSQDFMAFMGIRHSVQSKPLRGILLVRKKGDYSEAV